MKRQSKLGLFALSLVLCATSTVLGQGPTFAAIDYPGAATTTPWGINTRGDIVGFYVSADKVTHGFLLSGDQYSTVDFPDAAFSFPSGINPQGDISGNCCTVAHGYLLSDGVFTSWDFPGATFTNTTG